MVFKHKMGIKASTPASLPSATSVSVAASRPSAGCSARCTQGIVQMFQVIENALDDGLYDDRHTVDLVTKLRWTSPSGSRAPGGRQAVTGSTITHHPRWPPADEPEVVRQASAPDIVFSWQDQVMIVSTAEDELRRRSTTCCCQFAEGLMLGAVAGVRPGPRRRRPSGRGLPAGLPDRAVRPRRQDRKKRPGYRRRSRARTCPPARSSRTRCRARLTLGDEIQAFIEAEGLCGSRSS